MIILPFILESFSMNRNFSSMSIDKLNATTQAKKGDTTNKTKINQNLSTKNRDSVLSNLKKLKMQVNSCIALVSQKRIDSSSLGSIKTLECQIISAGNKVENVSDKIKKSLIIKPSSVTDDKVS